MGVDGDPSCAAFDGVVETVRIDPQAEIGFLGAPVEGMGTVGLLVEVGSSHNPDQRQSFDARLLLALRVGAPNRGHPRHHLVNG